VALLLHIGLQKTASTWLQDKVFESAAVGFATVGGEAVVKRQLIAPADEMALLQAAPARQARPVDAAHRRPGRAKRKWSCGRTRVAARGADWAYKTGDRS